MALRKRYWSCRERRRNASYRRARRPRGGSTKHILEEARVGKGSDEVSNEGGHVARQHGCTILSFDGKLLERLTLQN